MSSTCCRCGTGTHSVALDGVFVCIGLCSTDLMWTGMDSNGSEEHAEEHTDVVGVIGSLDGPVE